MANHASALKAHRQSLSRNKRNSSNRSSLRTSLKRISQLIQSGKTEEAKRSIDRLYSVVDKAVQKKALSKNAAARHKSRLTKHLNSAVAAAGKE
jgi:small subunit ribosomal protein S20